MLRLFLILGLLLTPLGFAEDSAPAQSTVEQQRAELLEQIEDLQRRIPKDLRTDLAIISMKLATGYCSPYRVREFEDALSALPKGKQGRFAKELTKVQSNPLWPSLEQIEGEESTP
jgi:hypothetical protein